LPIFLARKKNANITRLKRKSFIAQAILILLGIECLFLIGFTAFSFPTATARNLQIYMTGKAYNLYSKLSPKIRREWETQVPFMVPVDQSVLPDVRYSLYVPQAPIAIFLGYVLGWPMALMAAAAYLTLGLIGPFFNLYPFAAGTGINYYLQPSFGYLIGMVAAAAYVGWLSRGERKSLNQLLSLFAGLVCIHCIGLIYLLGICLFGAVHEAVGEQLSWSQWLFEEARNLSWYALPYDLIFSLAAIGIGFPFRWLVGILTAPDIGLSNGSNGEEKLVEFRATK
jgi:biotin transporter BioY